MSTHDRAEAQTVPSDDIDLIAVLKTLLKHRRWVIGSVIALGCSALILSLTLPPLYTSTAKILPPQQQSSSMNLLLGQLGGLAGAAGGIAGLKNPGELYIGLLQSRTVADNLIQQFKLKQRYATETMDETRKALQSASTFNSGKDGLISINVEDKDPQFAAALANGYITQLIRLNQSLAVTDAAKRRLFFETQLKQTKEQLTAAETALRQTQERTGMIQPDGQVQAIMNTVTQLKASIAAKEVQLESLRSYATEQNPLYQRSRQELAGLKTQLAKLENGAEIAGDVMVPTGKMPQSGLEYLRRLREVKYQETIFELLAKQYELARIDEAKDSSQIQILDSAAIPELKSKPVRSLITAAGLFSGLVLGIALALLRERFQIAQQSGRLHELNWALKER
ncbi:Wzz/FepE/Etk N-terminal domain-containing protein [Chromobacterium sp. S0633]|uniref:GumC family protein n=1 Tax=Chromobacterium sp. S0633 TaxID=2957805 RepID=UPI00209DB4F8|nr:Wzz/FepE/Etk N-terminal domain-containing protein [Chromobacterium sp. S0633]MCP1290153.1 Wzz/FepE/Etk N-terminal domain-containing protein [Chromobacterium sp. S0633]